jgi:uncharacterized membrane-anchored protein YjiN (DUF445 family)
MKELATVLLLLAAVVYLATRDREGALGFVNATAEAAMVGAIADWFAVTALFRRPLGLPIPHTAIIPTRKDALGRSLEEFVTANFLSEEVVRDKLARAQVVRRVAAWLVDPAHAARVVAEASTVARGLLRVVRDEEAAALLGPMVLRGLSERGWSETGGRLLERIVREGSHHRLVDLGLDEGRAWLVENQEQVIEIIAERGPTWTPEWVDRQIGRRIYLEALRFVTEVRDTPGHRVRKALDDLIARFAQDLQEDPATMERAEQWMRRLVQRPEVSEAVAAMWATARRALEEAIEDPASDLRRRAVSGLLELGERLLADDDLRGRVDTYLADAVGHVVRGYAPEVATVISDTVQRWDATEASRRIELHVGRDLQFIRINGTVVGGLAGLLIHTISVALG